MQIPNKIKMKDFFFTVINFCLRTTYYAGVMVGHLRNVGLTFAQMPDRISNVEFITVSLTIANTMLCAVIFFIIFN